MQIFSLDLPFIFKRKKAFKIVKIKIEIIYNLNIFTLSITKSLKHIVDFNTWYPSYLIINFVYSKESKKLKIIATFPISCKNLNRRPCF